MANETTRRTRRGAAVACSDGPLGVVERMEQDAEGRPLYLRVTPNAGGEDLLIPLELIRDVRDDGTVVLTCTCAELERWAEAPAAAAATMTPADAQPVGTLHLHEEELVAHKELQTVGEVQVRTQVEEFPGRLEVAALREEVEVEHTPVGQVVAERVAPWEENGALVVPVYEEQLVVVKRLVLREQLRIRRVAMTEHRLFEDTLRRERLVVDDPARTGLVHELYATEGEQDGTPVADTAQQEPPKETGGFLDNLRRALS